MRVYKRPAGMVLLGAVVALLLAIACEAAEAPATQTPQTPAATTVSTPAPVVPASPASPGPAGQPAAPSAPAATTALFKPGQPPPVTGGPLGVAVAIPIRNESYPYAGAQIFYKYHPDKLRLWEKATYGGDNRGTGWASPVYFDPLKFNTLARTNMYGLMLLQDLGRCSLVGREDFSKCNGVRTMNMTTVVVPGIFKSWEHPDPLTYVFKVRQGVLWPAIPPMNRPDREVTAEDIKWYYEVMQRESISKTTFERVAKIEATDRYTVRLTLSQPEAELIYALTHHNLGLFARECYEDKDACWGKKIISPGPFILTVDEPRQRAVFERNPEFWLKGLPYLDRKTVNNITDPNAQKSAFLSGQLDDITLLIPSEVTSMERQVPGVQVDDIFGAPGQYHYDMQLDKPPFNDVRVRRAISMAIDRPSLWQLAGEGHILPGMPMPWHLMGRELPITLDEAGQWYKYDPAKAKALLAEAGYPSGMKIRVNSQWASGVHADLNTGIADMLKRNLNIEIEYKVMDVTAFTSLFYAGNWEGFYFTWCAIAGCAAMDATTYIIPFYSKSPQNTRHLNDPKWDELYFRWRASKDSKGFQDLLWEMNRYEMDNVLKIWIGSAGFFQVMPPWVENAAMHATTWGSVLNGPAWLTMIDLSKKPK